MSFHKASLSLASPIYFEAAPPVQLFHDLGFAVSLLFLTTDRDM